MRKPHTRLSRLTLAMLSTSLMAVTVPSLAAKKLEPKQDFDNASVIVKFKETAKKADRKQLMAQFGSSFKDKNHDGVDDRFRHIAKGRLAELTVPRGLDARAMVERLKHNPHIEYAELNHRFYPSVIPNDPSYGQLWGMPKINAEQAWEMEMGSREVVVGVIDTGFDYTHPDLRDNIWVNPNEVPNNGIDDDGNGYIDDIHGISAINDNGNPQDTHYHGTHVAGTIGATGNNGSGVVGVNWNTAMVGCSFLGSQGGTTADGIQCIDYMVDLKNRGVNIRVLNNSWGGGSFSQALEDAITAANNADILFVAAAGNDAIDNDVNDSWPANHDVANVMAIASTTRDDEMSYFSQWGLNTVDMGAPGSDVYSTVPGSDYNTLSGTSMATPHVAGAAALILAADPTLTTADVKNILMSSGDPIAALEGKTVTGKRLNLESALNMAGAGGPGYYLLVSPASRTVNQDSSVTFDIDMNAVGGYNGNASFSADLPAGLNAAVSFSSNTVPADGRTIMTVSTDANTTLGNHIITINAVDGDIHKSIDVSLLVYPAGTFSTTYSNENPLAIPDDNADGVSSVINVPINLTLTDLVVNLDIAHTYIGDLLVTLTSPSGRTVTLHNRTGGSADNLVASYAVEDFDLEEASGDWILHITDSGFRDTGTLKSWSMDVTGGSQPGTNLPPTVTIGANLQNALYLPGDVVNFVADATDSEDGDVRASLVWTSSLDGQIGTGGNFSRSDLSQGTHQITVTASDSQGVVSSREFFLYIVSDGTLVSYEDTNRQPIFDMGTIVAEIEVPLGLKIKDMNLFVDIQHSLANDMLIHLVSPDGTRVEIFDRKGSDEYYRDLVKTFYPVEFNGEMAAGIWQLIIKDEWSGNSGWLNRWALSFTHDGDAGIPDNQAPVVNILAPVGGSSVIEGDTVAFMGSANDAEDGDVANTLEWTSDLDGVIGQGVSFSTNSLSVGQHTVTASAADSQAANGVALVTLTVEAAPVNELPSAEFSFQVNHLDVNFADASGDNDGAVVAWAWDFGDGNISSLANPSHSYASGGSYEVTLTVTDNSGASHSISKQVSVAAAISLSGAGSTDGSKVNVNLNWNGSSARAIDIYRDGQLIDSTRDRGSYKERFNSSAESFEYKVCEAGSNICSELITVTPELSRKGKGK